MRKNILVRSMLRQKARTVVLILLILVSSFAFVMRAVEYIVITDEIERIAEFYRPVGFIRNMRGGIPDLNNVMGAADIIRDSPFVEFEDRRRSFQGVLHGVQNLDIEGGRHVAEEPLQYRLTDAFFYGELISVSTDPVSNRTPPPPWIWMIELRFWVDYVLVGYPEHVLAGQELVIYYTMTEEEFQAHQNASTMKNMEKG